MDVIQEIKELPRWNSTQCSCGNVLRTCSLQINSICSKCGAEEKQRAFGSLGTETQDLIDTMLEWAGTGEGLESLLKRHSEIHSHKEKND
jgi:hypothetical protein